MPISLYIIFTITGLIAIGHRLDLAMVCCVIIKSMRKTILAIIGGVLVGAIFWQALPNLVTILPGRVQQRLPTQLLTLAMTPLPTALPAPAISQPLPITLVPPLPTVTQTPNPTPTPSPPAATVTTDTAVPTTPPTASPTAPPSLTPLPTAVQLTGLTIIPQKFNNCGPANLSLTLAYFDFEVEQLAIAAVLRPNERDRNVSPTEMVAYVNNETSLRAAVYWGGDLNLLKRFISAGFPVIIEKGLFPNEWEGWMGHYLTVVGYDDAAQEFTSLDTFLGPWDSSGRVDSYATITEFWGQFNYAFVLVYRPEQAAEVQAILGTDMVDGRTMWQMTAQRAQTEIEADPGNAYAWFNLGSSLTRLAQLTGQDDLWQNAAAAFDQARIIGLPWRMLWYQFAPYQAYLAVGRPQDVLTLTEATLSSEGGQNVEETYFFRGLALQAVGETAAADTAFAQATALNPNVVNFYQKTLPPVP